MATLAHRLFRAASVQVESRMCVLGTRTSLKEASNLQFVCASNLLQPQNANQGLRLLSTKAINLSASPCLSKSLLFPKGSSQLHLVRVLLSTQSYEDELNVHYEDLCQRLENGNIQLIDVREPSELETFGQIQSSVNIPLGELADALRLPADKFEARYLCPKPQEEDDNIVFHCRSGVRSLNAINIAKENGFSKSRHFPGGWLQWAQKNDLPYA